uniref:Dectin-2 n=1 Tax=Lutjanus peru TaxID=290247 RepID=A0A6B9MHF4_LUTPE|nr:dectin-2 [Lutjanus peru]
MSCDIYAKPDLSKKVRYNRKEQEDEVEWEEREVDIYESADAVGHDHTDVQSHEGGPHDEKHREAVYRRPLTAVVLCVGGLCCLLLIGIITIFTHSIKVNSQLKSSYETLRTNHIQLQTEVKQLTDKMSVNNSQLQDEIKQLKGKIEGGMCCPEGWKRFGCSCYFKSNEKKRWSESRSDCQNKGADLVVINNKEEQKFLTGLNPYGQFWIGLQATKENRNTGRQEWEWVDKSPLTEMFRESGLSQYSEQQYRSAACCDHEGRWTHTGYYDSGSRVVQKYWICEK